LACLAISDVGMTGLVGQKTSDSGCNLRKSRLQLYADEVKFPNCSAPKRHVKGDIGLFLYFPAC
jgi:hypothetical protein